MAKRKTTPPSDEQPALDAGQDTVDPAAPADGENANGNPEPTAENAAENPHETINEPQTDDQEPEAEAEEQEPAEEETEDAPPAEPADENDEEGEEDEDEEEENGEEGEDEENSEEEDEETDEDEDEAGSEDEGESEDEEGEGEPENALPLTSIVEAVLFAAREPLKTAQIARAVGKRTRQDAVKAAVEDLNVQYLETGRAFEIAEISGKYQLMSRPEYASHIMRIYPKRELTDKDAKSQRLTPAMLDTLAIIAYKQPVMRSEIDQIRGSACANHLRALIERGTVKEMGRRSDLVGKPAVFGTTERFLAEFGLGSLDELPMRNEFITPGAPPPLELAETESDAAGANAPDEKPAEEEEREPEGEQEGEQEEETSPETESPEAEAETEAEAEAEAETEVEGGDEDETE